MTPRQRVLKRIRGAEDRLEGVIVQHNMREFIKLGLTAGVAKEQLRCHLAMLRYLVRKAKEGR